MRIHVEGTELCAGSVDHLDRHIERIFAFLGEPVPSDFVVPIEIGSPDHPCESSNCFDDGKVWVRALDTSGVLERPSAILRHELVHAVHARAWGLSVPFINEGLADALSRVTDSRPGSMAIGDMLDKPPLELSYDEAARFVRFLLDTRGLSRFRELSRGAPGRDAAGLRAWIGEVYGEAFEDIEAEYLSGAPRCYYQLHLCDPVEAERVEDDWYATLPASCSDAEFYGAADADGELFATRRTLELVRGGRYQVSSRFAFEPLGAGSIAASVTVVRCGDCDQISVDEVNLSSVERELSAGIYALEIVMPFDTVVSVSLVRVGD